MPAYSFKERFVPMILDGSKRQTIRARRKNAPKPGQMAYLYYGMRTKNCRKLGEYEIEAVKGIYIDTLGFVYLFDKLLDDMEIEIAKTDPFGFSASKLCLATYRDQFAWNDGFRPEGSICGSPGRAFDLMIRFWKQTHSLPFVGDVIYW